MMFIVQEKIYTYSEDFFMTAFFTLRARGVSITVLVAGGGVTPAGATVPATAMVTAPVAAVSHVACRPNGAESVILLHKSRRTGRLLCKKRSILTVKISS
jgi:hypothetical protein